MYREKSNYYFGIKPSEGVEVSLETELISEKGEFIKPPNERVLAATLPYIIESATIQFVFTPISSCNECYTVTFVVIKKDQLSYRKQLNYVNVMMDLLGYPVKSSQTVPKL